MKLTIYLIRHGQDPDGYRGGWSNLGLTEVGITQCKELASFLTRQRIALDSLITSDLERAWMTAEILGQKLNVSVTKSSDWRETNNGDLAGMPEAEARKRYPGLFFKTLEWDQPYPGGESPQQFRDRIHNAFSNLVLQMETGQTGHRVGLVTHNGVITVLTALMTDSPWSNRNTGIGRPPAGIRVFKRDSGHWRYLDVQAKEN